MEGLLELYLDDIKADKESCGMNNYDDFLIIKTLEETLIHIFHQSLYLVTKHLTDQLFGLFGMGKKVDHRLRLHCRA